MKAINIFLKTTCSPEGEFDARTQSRHALRRRTPFYEWREGETHDQFITQITCPYSQSKGARLRVNFPDYVKGTIPYRNLR